jgi:hypothetical protein
MEDMFTKVQTDNIIEKWGKDVYLKLLNDIKTYSEKWKLSDFVFFESYSMNAIFFCRSEIYGECVLKIGSNFQDDEFIWEYNVLREYNGRRFVKVFESDIEIKTRKKAMLIERVFPGNMLKDEQSLDKRLSVFSELFNGMHINPENTALYKKYVDGISYSVETISKRKDCKDLCWHMMKAKDVCMTVSASYNREMLLHGDLHFHNILRKDDGNYAIIDPQGRVGDLVFDVPRYILIEYYNSAMEERIDKINHIIEYLRSNLNIPNEILRQCFYIETASFECWFASVGNYDINNVIFAEKIMNNKNL